MVPGAITFSLFLRSQVASAFANIGSVLNLDARQNGDGAQEHVLPPNSRESNAETGHKPSP